MPSDPALPVVVSFTPEFQRNLRQLAKKYRHIKTDIQPIIDELIDGKKPGDQVPRVNFEVFKVRAKNSDAKRGKSGGYRLIYYAKNPTEVILVTIYSKTEQSDIAPEDIRQIILDLETTSAQDAVPEQRPDSGEPQSGH